MSRPETTGPEHAPNEPLRARMLQESTRVLGALPDGDTRVRRILHAAHGTIDNLRNTIAGRYPCGVAPRSDRPQRPRNKLLDALVAWPTRCRVVAAA